MSCVIWDLFLKEKLSITNLKSTKCLVMMLFLSCLKLEIILLQKPDWRNVTRSSILQSSLFSSTFSLTHINKIPQPIIYVFQQHLGCKEESEKGPLYVRLIKIKKSKEHSKKQSKMSERWRKQQTLPAWTFRKDFNYQADCFATKNEEIREVV